MWLILPIPSYKIVELRLVRINTLFHHTEKYRHPWELLSILTFGRLHPRVEWVGHQKFGELPLGSVSGRSRPSPLCNRWAGNQNSVVCWSVRSAGGERIGLSTEWSNPRYFNIFWMTSGSSIDAMIRTGPPHLSHFSISMANTRLSRCAQVIE